MKTKEIFENDCKYCKNLFETDKRNSKVCFKCFEKNHLAKIEKTLFGGEVLFMTISQ